MGCASTEPARDVARITLKQLIEYEKQLDSKIAAEQKFYETYKRIIKEARQENASFSIDNIYARDSQNFETLLLKSQSGFNASDLRDSITTSLGKIQLEYLRTAEETAELEKQLANALQKIEHDKKKTKKVRDGLVDLQKQPSDMQELQRIAEFTGEVYELVTEENSDTDSQSPANPN